MQDTGISAKTKWKPFGGVRDVLSICVWRKVCWALVVVFRVDRCCRLGVVLCFIKQGYKREFALGCMVAGLNSSWWGWDNPRDVRLVMLGWRSEACMGNLISFYCHQKACYNEACSVIPRIFCIISLSKPCYVAYPCPLDEDTCLDKVVQTLIYLPVYVTIGARRDTLPAFDPASGISTTTAFAFLTTRAGFIPDGEQSIIYPARAA